MACFIPNWGGINESNGLFKDDLIGKMKSCSEAGIQYKIIVTHHVPNLRTFLHEQELLEVECISLFDKLQGFESDSNRIIRLDDLYFSQEVQFVFTPFCVLAISDDIIVGKVYYTSNNQISEVHHLLEGFLIRIDSFDERGFLSKRTYFRDNEKYSSEYVDIKGDWVFKHYHDNNSCIVNDNNTHGLSSRYYPSHEELIGEMLNNQLKKCKVPVIFSFSESNHKLLKFLDTSHRIILSLFSERIKDFTIMHDIIKRYKSNFFKVIADNRELCNHLNTFKEYEVVFMPLMSTTLLLGDSMEKQGEMIFVNSLVLNKELNKSVLAIFIEFIINNLIHSNDKKDIKFLIREDSFYDIKELIQAIREQVYSRTQSLTNTEGKEELINEVREAFIVKKIDSGIQLEQIIRHSRMIIDFSERPDSYVQLLGISSGIPQINFSVSDYVIHMGNGLILIDIEKELGLALYNYMNDIEMCQRARTFSVKQIKRFSSHKLSEDLLRLVKHD